MKRKPTISSASAKSVIATGTVMTRSRCSVLRTVAWSSAGEVTQRREATGNVAVVSTSGMKLNASTTREAAPYHPTVASSAI